MKSSRRYLPFNLVHHLARLKNKLIGAPSKISNNNVIKPLDFPSNLTKDDEHLMSLRNIHAGRRAFLLGNGPSVLIEDLERLKDEITFAANRFYMAYDQFDLKMHPTYTICVDLLVLKNHGAEIAAKCNTPFFVSGRLSSFTEVENFRTENMVILRETHSPLTADNPNNFLFSENPVEMIGQGYGVIYAMMQLAAWMGIRRMLLYGIDHNFTLPKDYIKPGVKVTHGGENNHFILNYRNMGENWAPPNFSKTEAGYHTAKKFCEARGIEIYNCTRGGQLEIFERRSFDEELVNICR